MYNVHIHRICGDVSTTNIIRCSSYKRALDAQRIMAELLDTMSFSIDDSIDGATESVQIMIQPNEDGDIYCAAIYTR